MTGAAPLSGEDQVVALTGARIFDGTALHAGGALVMAGGRLCGPVPSSPPDGAEVVTLDGGVLAPGFVDCQVNGGGGIMLGQQPDAAGVAQIAAIHARLGATTILPTLISARREVVAAAIAAVADAQARGVAGIAGLHLEGPHLSPSRAGAHDPALLRVPEAADLALYGEAAARLRRLVVTLAPETVAEGTVAQLAASGVVVAIGHSEASYATCRAAAAAGARMVTHLHNAMRPAVAREPGVAGAALDLGGLSAGLIADGHHVHPALLRAALAAKRGPGELFLVSDAMAPAGTQSGAGAGAFELGGRRVLRRGGRLILADGTLAGADLDLAGAIRVMVREAGCPLERALAMATSVPAAAAGLTAPGAPGPGWLRHGGPADLVHLSDDLRLAAVWQGGRRLVVAPAAPVAPVD